MTEALKPSDVLSRAADLIEPEGAWTKGAFARAAPDPDNAWAGPAWPAVRTCWCMRGALAEALGCTPVGIPETFEAFVRAAIPQSFSSVDFNDATGRTQAEVVAALRKAADLARSEGQ